MASDQAGVRAAAIADEIALITLLLLRHRPDRAAPMAIHVPQPSRFSGDGVAARAPPPDLHCTVRSVLLFSTAVIGAMNLLPSLIAPIEFGGGWQLDASYVAHALAQAASSGLACLFVFFAILAIQGVLLNVLPANLFARVSVLCARHARRPVPARRIL